MKQMKKKTSLILKDDKYTRNIVIQINLKNNTTSILSSFSSWDNLALIMEGLSVTAQKCVQEGINKKHVYEAIKNYLMQVLGNYEIIKSSRER